jgi:zinc transport system substrate-binding protein
MDQQARKRWIFLQESAIINGKMKKILCFLLCLLCMGCSSEEKGRKVLVSIPPYVTIVKSLVGDEASIEVVVPSGMNPHIYEPAPEQIKSFTQTNVWFRTGDPIEGKIAHFLKGYPVQIVDLSKGRENLNAHTCSHHAGTDLHLWLDPLIMADQVQEITGILMNQFPEMTATLKENSQKVIEALRERDEEIKTKLSPFRGQDLLVSHPALGYFCKRYGLHQLSVEIEGKDPLPQDIAKLMHQLKNHPVPVIFTEPQHNNKGAVLIAEKLDLPLEEIDPYAENYFDFLESFPQLIVDYYGHPN